MIFEVALLIVQVILLGVAAQSLYIFTAMAVSSCFDAPFVPTKRKTILAAIQALQIIEGSVVYELGSGDGRFLIRAAILHPEARYVGIERNIFLIWIARIMAKQKGVADKVRFIRTDILNADLTRANSMYCYLLPEMMRKLAPVLKAQLRGARVVSNTFQFKNFIPLEIIDTSRKKRRGIGTLYIYDF